MTQSIALTPGSNVGFTLTGAPSFAVGGLFLGVAFPAGVPYGPCNFYLSGPIGPLTVNSYVTNFAGSWTSPGFTIPNDPNLIGLEIAHQAVVIDPVTNTLIFSNATSSQIGW